VEELVVVVEHPRFDKSISLPVARFAQNFVLSIVSSQLGQDPGGEEAQATQMTDALDKLDAVCAERRAGAKRHAGGWGSKDWERQDGSRE
jgi:hypothetical protein